MVLFNYSTKEITAKLVYYGPGLGGKTTNLQFIHSKLDPKSCGKLLSLATESDRTLFFDFLPLELGKIGGFHVRFQLYTVPGQVHYNATRRMVLKGVDAIVFVADSQLEMMESNRESFVNLRENLVENGYRIESIPVVLQANKRDLPNIASAEEIIAAIDAPGYQIFEAVANRGDGVLETLRAIIKLSVHKLREQFREQDVPQQVAEEAPERPEPPPGYQPQPLVSPDTPYIGESFSPAAAGTEQSMQAIGNEVPLDEEVSFEGVDSLAEEIDLEEPGRDAGKGGSAGIEERVEGLAAEIKRLAEENRKIRSALKGIYAGMERQIKILEGMIASADAAGEEKQEAGTMDPPPESDT